MSKELIFGYARVSTAKQSIKRQIDNIRSAFPDAKIIEECYTGTKLEGRERLNNLIKVVKPGDTIVFDEVSRMSRNAAEGFSLYQELYDRGIRLVFIKEPHLNTDVFKRALDNRIQISVNTGSGATDRFMENIVAALNKLTMDLAKEQIELAFQTAQHEVDFLHQRTSEGVRKAQMAGKQVGREKGSTIETKKAKEMKAKIKKLCKDFSGNLSDSECVEMLKIARNTYYKYKRQIKEDMDIKTV